VAFTNFFETFARPRRAGNILEPPPDEQPHSGSGHHYDPNQPRVPAGRPDAGQWTRGWGGAPAISTEDIRRWSETFQSVPTRNRTGPADDFHRENSAGEVQNGRLSSDAVVSDLIPDDLWLPGSDIAAGGNEPNIQHQKGVAAAIQEYARRNYSIFVDRSVAVDVPGFGEPRFYDFIVRDPTNGYLIGVEVKTTLYETIRLDTEQVAKDVVVMRDGGTIRSLKETVQGVGYITYCVGCDLVDTRSKRLHWALRAAKIPFIHGGRPGDTLP
jgi:hypothetical protein